MTETELLTQAINDLLYFFEHDLPTLMMVWLFIQGLGHGLR
jgi:hypothetical protein